MALVISGGYPIEGGESVKTMKRKFKYIMNVGSSFAAEVNSTQPPISFVEEDLFCRHPNKYIPLLIQDGMANFEVMRILVDQGGSSDIIYIQLLNTMRIS